MSVKKTHEQPASNSKTTQFLRKMQALVKSGHRLSIGLGLGGVAMVASAVGAIVAISISSTPLLQHKLSPEEAAVFGGDRISKNSLGFAELTRPVNILVLGMSVLPSDVGKSSSEIRTIGYEPEIHSVDGLSDTMLLLRFEPQKHNLTVLSIPRDTRIVMEKYGVQKINATNPLGGPTLAAKEVSHLLGGVTIDRYIRVNVLAVSQVVDALGGLTLYVPKNMKYRDDSQHLYINLKQGKQHLNGNMTMQLLRFRYDESGDLGRMQRQQLVLRALMAQTLNPTTIVKIPKLLETLKSDVDTNLSIEELIALGGFAAQTDRSHVQGLIVPGDFNGDGRHEISYWLPDRRRIETMMAQYFDQGVVGRFVVDKASIRVSIQDSTHNPHAVQVLVDRLQKAGYQNVSTDTSTLSPLEVTQIVAQQGDSESASNISQTLGFGEVRVETSGTLYSDVTIQLGRDSLSRLDLPNSVSTDFDNTGGMKMTKGVKTDKREKGRWRGREKT